MQAPPRTLRLAQRSNPGRYRAIGTPRLINCYVERQGPDGKSEWPILASPGLDRWMKVTEEAGAICRGLFKVTEDRALGVYGQSIYEIQKSGIASLVGGIGGTDPCFFARNRNPLGIEVAIVCRNNKRVYQYATSSVVDISDPDLPDNVVGCDTIASYILFFLDDGRVFYSDLNSALSIAALSYVEAEARPDGLAGGIVHEGVAWFYGDESTEIWGLTDNADAPLARIQNASLEQGCLAGASITKVQVPGGTRLAWVANDKTVRMSNGYTGERISDHAVERAISALPDPETIQAFSYSLDGHVFVVFNSSRWTWVYNATTSLWHEEMSYGSTRRKWAFHMDFAGKPLIGSSVDGELYEASHDSYLDGGQPLVCEIVTPQDSAYPNDIEYNALYIDSLPGSGVNDPNSPAIFSPEIRVRWSFDNANTWGPWRQLATGKVGEHRKRVVTHQLGTSFEDGAVFHLLWSSGVARAITGAAVDSQTVQA